MQTRSATGWQTCWGMVSQTVSQTVSQAVSQTWWQATSVTQPHLVTVLQTVSQALSRGQGRFLQTFEHCCSGQQAYLWTFWQMVRGICWQTSRGTCSQTVVGTRSQASPTSSRQKPSGRAAPSSRAWTSACTAGGAKGRCGVTVKLSPSRMGMTRAGTCWTCATSSPREAMAATSSSAMAGRFSGASRQPMAGRQTDTSHARSYQLNTL